MTADPSQLLPHLTIYGPDGTPDSGDLSQRERQTLAAIDKALQTNPKFQAQYPQAQLERLECMRGLPETGPGRYYLCYRSNGQLYEFWGGLGAKASVNLKQGLVSVRQEDIS